jgi:hypothetical protein
MWKTAATALRNRKTGQNSGFSAWLTGSGMRQDDFPAWQDDPAVRQNGFPVRQNDPAVR